MCLCGGVRFLEPFDAASLAETLAVRMVLSVGSHRQRDEDAFADLPDTQKGEMFARLAELHRHKIDLADEILVVNVGGYTGESTRSEMEYARHRGKRIRWLEPHND